MTKVVKCLFCALLLSAVFIPKAVAATITAASCSQNAVASALAQAVDGDTVFIPAGTCIWTSTVSVSGKALTIMGAGAQAPAGGTDQTIIVDNVPHIPSDNATFDITTSAGKKFRLTAIAFQGGTGGTTFNGAVRIGGSSQQVRIDHVHFNKIDGLALLISGWEYGVMDHCLVDAVSGTVNNGVRVLHDQWNNQQNGDGSWADLPYFGTNKAFFIEDSTFNNGFANDALAGSRLVFRHNAINHSAFQIHEMSARLRSARMIEVYNNIFTWGGDPSLDTFAFAMYLRGGTGVIWANTTTGYINMVSAHNDRSSTILQFLWGYCNGSNPWDQNSDATGYPCLDQIGRGKGDLITGDNPLNSVTQTMAWPHQASEPMYEWGNTYNPPPNNAFDALWSTSEVNVIRQNRDYFLSTQMPGYIPFTYPHPFVSGAEPPAPPPRLKAVAR